MQRPYQLVIVGAGILGAATAREYLQRHPGHRVLVIEKEGEPASHQTGRNSGVIHAGVYYPPGSLKARYCKEGLEQTIAFCQDHNIPYLQCGKLIVATNPLEEERLGALFGRCQENGLDPQYLHATALKTAEPNIEGRAAILVRQTGIVDYARITRTMLGQAQSMGAEVQYKARVMALNETEHEMRIDTPHGSYRAERLVNCAGLMADRLIRLQGIATDFQIVPFRGEYYRLPSRFNQIVNHLIYPVPDPALPFLGVHLTPIIDGSVTVGPNAVLALAREGYDWSSINPADLLELCSFSGFWSLLWRYRQSGTLELGNSLFKSRYLAQVRKYCPQIGIDDLLPHRSGVRAQAVTASGELMHDFAFVQTARSLHLGNAPSPAATSAIPIARAIVDKLDG
ncbi:L-2-hydroxyglutarate oxidase [Aliiglaciecola sp. CAU 1673]|uniref:L-2-hydroxyglutarate oxidase n=1 Tax=Aliiglaciecola sp. CAU 1673 TaxID=3032595 RepID=UPI0023DA1040|nr:L-2-hydroxyglutarate oxidase [Aliiglaciecola sp. CAU 1673]MDF2177675.1 L-2-hydroxyglutarate oxidase [Aliiglaciecola sp. CAU 1673]